MPKMDYGTAASGAMTGASLGGAFGGPVGAGVGALGGGIAGLFGGGKKKGKKRSTMSKPQQQLFQQYIQAAQTGQGPLADLFGPNDMNGYRSFFQRNYADPQIQKFKEDIIPQITGQFRGQNLQNSSYLGESLSRAGRDVQKNLDDRLADMMFKAQEQGTERRGNAIQNILGMNTQAQGLPRESAVSGILSSLSPVAGKLITDYLGPGSSGSNAFGSSSNNPFDSLQMANNIRG